MKRWQKYWLYGVGVFFGFHLVRDVLQDLHVNSVIFDTLVKADQSNVPKWYWQVFNTYVFDISLIVLPIICLKRNRFSTLGYLTIALALLLIVIWLVYWIMY